MRYWVIPIPFEWLAFAIAPFIFLPPRVYRNYKNGMLSALDESILEHEKVHIERQRAQGLLIFGYYYLTNKSFRLKEELIAIQKQMQFLKEHGCTYDIESKARQFAGPTYGSVLTYDEAHRALTNLWEGGILER